MNTTAASMDFCAASTKATRKNSSPPRFSAPESSSHACMRSVPSRRMRRTHAAYTKASGAFRRRSDHFAPRVLDMPARKELAIYRFAAKLYREGKPLLQRLSDETYHPLLRAVRQLNGELEQYRGFVRFFRHRRRARRGDRTEKPRSAASARSLLPALPTMRPFFPL